MKKQIKALILFLVLLLSFVVLCGCVGVHQHTFEDKWTCDGINHYHKSTCDHDVVESIEKHQFDTGVENATTVVYSCTVCGYQKTEQKPAPHQHTYSSEWTTNETHHWKEATCEHTTEKGSLGTHQFDAGQVNSEQKVTVYTCLDCGYTKSEPLPHQHVYEGAWTVRTPATILTEGVEYRVCQGGDNCQEEETQPIAKVAVASIAVTIQPTKTAYTEGERFDPTGIFVTATGVDSSTADVTAFVTYDKTTLSVEDTFITVTYQDKTAQIEVVVKSAVETVGVKQIKTTDDYINVMLLCGYFVGLSDEGYNNPNEILLKDKTTDDVIAVRNLPSDYGEWPNVGYSYGDEVKLYGKLVKLTYVSGDNTTQNKVYFDVEGQNNPADINDTIVSKNNVVTYNFDQVKELNDWKNWQSLFKVSTIEAYTYIKISGKVYLNSYTAKDDITIHRIHANGAAEKLDGIKPDGVRALGFRETSLNFNIGDWRQLFNYPENSASNVYPGEEKTVEIFAIVTAINNVNYQLTVLESSWIKLVDATEFNYTNEQVLVEVAYAFHRQGTQAEYDMTKGRRDVNASPEDATDEDALILDCSSYANAVYYEAFGESIIKGADGSSTATLTSYAKENAGKSADVVGYWENADYTTDEEKLKLLAEIKNMLQVGDCIVYRHGASGPTGGHVMVYVGNGTLLHSTGTSYYYNSDATKSYDKATKDEHNISTVQTMSVDVLFTQSTQYPKRYLFYTSANDSTYNFCILRPLNRGLTPTTESKNRMSIQGLDMEKSVSVGAYSAIYNNSQVTYNVRLTNTSNVDLKEVTFHEILSSYSTFVSSQSGVVSAGQRLSWVGDVSANSTVNVSYTVMVSANEKQAVVVSKSSVNGVNLNTIYNSVAHYSADQMQQVANKALEIGNAGATYDNPSLFVKDVYKTVLGVEIFEYAKIVPVLDDVIDTTNKTKRSDTVLSQTVAPHLYGGLDIYSGYTKDSLRVRLVEKANLAVGDVIVAEKGENSMSAIYIGDGKLVVIYSQTDVCQVVDVGTEDYRLSGSYYILDTFLAQLIAYDRYAVIRPSFN